PVVWGAVGDVLDLFKLFPSVIVTYPPSGAPVLSLRPTELDFSRFKLYAPHVKSVQIYSRRFFAFSKWTILNSVLHQRPFLPKLQSLVIHTWDLPRPRTLLYLGWINWLMSSSLNNVCITGNHNPDSFMSSLEVAAILQTLTEGCPQLEQLVLPDCSSRASVVSEDMSISLGLLQTRPLEYYLAQLHNLRELQGNLLLLTLEVIPTISALPQLRSLRLNRVCQESIPTSVKFDPSAFSALESLRLTRIEASRVGDALDLIPALAQLTRFELETESDVEEGWLVTTLLPRLEQMTHLTVLHLSLDVISVSIEDDSLNSPAAISAFSKLPLEEIKLRGVIIDDSTDLASMFPSIRRLYIPDAETCISLVRKARDVRDRMAEKYGQEEAELMFPLDFFSN
ncbi:hypothetical protein FRC12_018190, partial [Ceratobasidium sp. 428]